MGSQSEQLKVKLSEWRSWMYDKDPHSITNQIYTMLWNDATYRVIQECRRVAPPADEGGIQMNWLVHVFIDRCYFENQTLAIRRLSDKNPTTSKDRDIISLRRILDDLERHANTITRANMFAAEGLPYDYAQQKKQSDEDDERRCREALAQGKHGFGSDMTLYNAWRIPAELHRDFDRMSRTDAISRSPDDVLDMGLISALKDRLQVCDDVYTFVNKQVAHAAHPDNRDAVPEPQRSVCLQRIRDCHMAICRVTSCISVYLLRGPELSFLALPQFDPFRYIDRPWIDGDKIAVLRSAWDEHHKQCHEWGQPELPTGW